MADRGAHDEHFGEQALMPGTAPEICGDNVGNVIRGILDCLREPSKGRATLLQRRRPVPQERLALALKDGGELECGIHSLYSWPLPRTARAPFNSAEDTSRLRSLTCIKDDACFRDQLNF